MNVRKHLFILHGFQATGKSTTAKILSDLLGIEIIATHRVREELFPTQVLYTREAIQAVYEQVISRATQELQDRSVIIDAMFAKRHQRQMAYQAAHNCGAQVIVIHCICDDLNEIIRRVDLRRTQVGSEAEGNRMQYYYRSKASSEILDGDTLPDSSKPLVVFVDTYNTYVTSETLESTFIQWLISELESTIRLYPNVRHHT